MNKAGKFFPKENNPHNQEFEVITKYEVFGSERQAFEGVKINGQKYHVYADWWTFIPASDIN